MNRLRQIFGVMSLVALIAGCSGTASPPANGSTPQPAGGGSTGAQPGGGTGANGFEGSLVTSAGYDATWTVSPDMEAGPFNSANSATLLSDKGTFGNVQVKPDGSVSFGSGAADFPGQLVGSGAKTTLDATGAFVCAFTVDTDLATTDGKTAHIAGTMTVHWHPEGSGDLSCP